jgi:hypothetical protein
VLTPLLHSWLQIVLRLQPKHASWFVFRSSLLCLLICYCMSTTTCDSCCQPLLTILICFSSSIAKGMASSDRKWPLVKGIPSDSFGPRWVSILALHFGLIMWIRGPTHVTGQLAVLSRGWANAPLSWPDRHSKED